MTGTKWFDDMSSKVSEMIAASPAKDIEKNIQSMMSSAFSKLDLVTKDEFEAQKELLAITNEKLDALSQRLEALESTTKSEN